jgi:hypothetical protein
MGNSMEREGIAFNNKVFWKVTVQLLLIGYTAIAGLGFGLLSYVEQYDIDLTISDFVHPLLWLFPALVAPIFGLVKARN